MGRNSSHDHKGDALIASSREKPLWRTAINYTLGYDYFIAYAWADGREYAVQLLDKLEKHRLECFIDSEDYQLGDSLTTMGRWKLKRTTCLVVVGSPEALKSKHVCREVKDFLDCGRRLIWIRFHKPDEVELKTPTEAERKAKPVLACIPFDTLRIDVTEDSLGARPSPNVIDQLIDNFEARTKLQQLIGILAAATLAFAAIAILAFFFWLRSDAHRRVAERRLQAAQKISREIVSTIDEQLEPLPQAQIRQQLLQESGELLDVLLEDSMNDDQILRLRYVQRGLQGNLALERNDLKEAEIRIESSLDAARESLARRPQDPVRQYDVSTGLMRLGMVFSRGGNETQAQQVWQEAVDGLRQLAAAEPNHLPYRRDCAAGLHAIARAMDAQGNFEEAMVTWNESHDLREALLQIDPESAEFRCDLATSYELLARLIRQDADASEGTTQREKALRKALRMRRALVVDHPFNAIYLRDLMISLNDLAKYSSQLLQDTEQAKVMLNESAQIARRLVAADPSSMKYFHDLMVVEHLLGSLEPLSAVNLEKRRNLYQRLADKSRQLEAQQPASVDFHIARADCLERLAIISRWRNEREAMYNYVEEAVAIRRRVVDRDPNIIGNRYALATALYEYARQRESDGETERARILYQEALALGQSLYVADPLDIDLAQGLHWAHGFMASQLVKTNKTAETRDHLERALKVARDLEKHEKYRRMYSLEVTRLEIELRGLSE